MPDFLDTPLHIVPKPAPKPPDFISMYLDYTADTECPAFFHRWTALTCLSAYLGRRTHFQHGHFVIHPNIYSMLIGAPGTKKSSAIKIGAKLLGMAGYTTFAAKKTRQEKYLCDLAEQAERTMQPDVVDNMMDENLWGDMPDSTLTEKSKYKDCAPVESFVAADEFNNFIGVGNLEFASILGELWDYDDVYDYRLKTSNSVYIPYPTITILGGNTPTGFSECFPTNAIGQGFFSRLLLVYGEPTGVKHTFPPPPDGIKQAELVAYLQRIKQEVTGEITLTPEAKELMETIYHNDPGIDDLRFEHYANRRLTHLIKLCLVVSASRISTVIEEEDIIYANTILSFTEQLMPKALGEFGRARNSDVTHKVMLALDNTMVPLSIPDLWKMTITDLENRQQLVEIMNNLLVAEKIQVVTGGYLAVKKLLGEGLEGTVDWNLLTPEEINLA
jgi:hypothetical protein